MPKPKARSNPEEIQQKEDPDAKQPTVNEEEGQEEESSDDDADNYSEGTLDDNSYEPNPETRQRTNGTRRKPVGQAKTLPAHKAPLLTRPDGFQTWKTRFLSYCFSIDPRYRRILEGRTTGNVGHEEQLYNALEYAVGDVQEALKIVTVLANSSITTKGSQAWKFLKQRYDRVSESRVQRLLDAHRRGQGYNESMASYLQRYQIQHEELKQLGHPHTERTTASSMVDGLRTEFKDIKQYFRIHRKDLDDLCETVETCLELYDCRANDNHERKPDNRGDSRRNTYNTQPNRGQRSNGNSYGRSPGSNADNSSAGSSAHVADSTKTAPKGRPKAVAAPNDKSAKKSSTDSTADDSQTEPRCHFCKQTGHLRNKCKLFFEMRKQARLQAGTYTPPEEKKTVHFAADMKSTDSTCESDDDDTNVMLVSMNPNSVLMSNHANDRQDTWILDSGATDHCTSMKSDFHSGTYEALTPFQLSGICCNALGKGNVTAKMTTTTGSTKTVTIKDVLYVPDLQEKSNVPRCRLLSLSKLQENSQASLHFTPEGSCIHIHGKFSIPINKPADQNLYYVQTTISNKPHDTKLVLPTINDYNLWHERLGHFGPKCIQRTGELTNLKIGNPHDGHFCDSCARHKASVAAKSRQLQDKPAVPFEKVGVDIWTPNCASVHMFKYVIGFVDYHSSYVFLYLMKNKSDSYKGLTAFLKFCGQHRLTPKTFRLDNDTTFKADKFTDQCSKAGIKMEYSSPHSPHQNGLIERTWRTLAESTFAMLESSGLKVEFWEYSVQTAAYLHNRTWRSSINDIPYHLVFNTYPDLTRLRRFGCPVWDTLPATEQSKVNGRAARGIHMGYSSNSPSYYVYSPISNTLHESRSVKFDEHFTGDLRDVKDCYKDWRLGKSSNKPTGPFALSWPEFPCLHMSCNSTYPASTNATQGKDAVLFSQSGMNVTDPKSYTAAINSSDSAEWLAAITDELNSHVALRTWTTTLLPAGRKAVWCKWVFKTKLGPTPGSTKKKARLVAKGFSQKQGIDFEETFAPTVGKSTIRTVMSYASANGWALEQADVDTAFLNATLKEDIYMTLPEGIYLIPDSPCAPTPSLLDESRRTGRQVAVKLHRALYGLKQSPRAWRQKLTSILSELGYSPSICDPGAYFQVVNGRIFCILLVYVDDILIACHNKHTATVFKDQLSKHVKIKDLQECKHILGISVRRDSTGIYLSQSQVIHQLLLDNNMQNCRPAPVPITAAYMQGHVWSGGETAGASTGANHLDNSHAATTANQHGVQLPDSLVSVQIAQGINIHAPSSYSSTAVTHDSHDKSQSDLSAADQSKFQSILGVILYISTCTRPDLSFAVSVLCRKMKQATDKDMDALKHLLRYLKGTKDEELALGKRQQGLTGFSDASFADCRTTRRSSAGYLFLFMGGTVSWKSNLLKTIALSTAEAEYMALSASAQEGVYLQQLITELKLTAGGIVQGSNTNSTNTDSDSTTGTPGVTNLHLFTDDQAAISIAEQNSPTAESKHISVRYYYLRQLVESGTLTLKYVPSTKQLADIFTKPLSAEKFRPLTAEILYGSQSDTCSGSRS